MACWTCIFENELAKRSVHDLSLMVNGLRLTSCLYETHVKIWRPDRSADANWTNAIYKEDMAKFWSDGDEAR